MQVKVIIRNRDFRKVVFKKKLLFQILTLKRALVQSNCNRGTHNVNLSACTTRLVTRSTRLTTCSTRITCLPTRSAHLSTCSTRLSIRSARLFTCGTCLSIRSTYS